MILQSLEVVTLLLYNIIYNFSEEVIYILLEIFDLGKLNFRVHK